MTNENETWKLMIERHAAYFCITFHPDGIFRPTMYWQNPLLFHPITKSLLFCLKRLRIFHDDGNRMGQGGVFVPYFVIQTNLNQMRAGRQVRDLNSEEHVKVSSWCLTIITDIRKTGDMIGLAISIKELNLRIKSANMCLRSYTVIMRNCSALTRNAE